MGAWHRDLLPKIREELEASREVFRNWNPLVELEARGFNRGKKMSYAETIIDELTGQSNPSDFYFTCFVKTGE